MCFLASPRGEFLWVKRADVSGVGFGPARCGVFLRGDGKLGVRFAIGSKKPRELPKEDWLWPFE